MCIRDRLNTALLIFAKEEESSLGDLTFSEKDGRWNLTVPPEGCTWIHENFQDPPFLKDFIQTLSLIHISTEVVQEKAEELGW